MTLCARSHQVISNVPGENKRLSAYLSNTVGKFSGPQPKRGRSRNPLHAAFHAHVRSWRLESSQLKASMRLPEAPTAGLRMKKSTRTKTATAHRNATAERLARPER